MHSGNGRTAMLSSHSTNHIHHFRFIVLVQVGKDLGLAGSAAGGLQKRFAQQISALNFHTLVKVGIQHGLLFDECLH